MYGRGMNRRSDILAMVGSLIAEWYAPVTSIHRIDDKLPSETGAHCGSRVQGARCGGVSFRYFNVALVFD
jgi:hypothetical protein